MSTHLTDPTIQIKDDKQIRSVFVGNIPYEASEEDLRVIFGRIGPVMNFRIVYDRESGKPKGYGFCEYRDQETALSAIRNLNNMELHNRNLRVDSAVNEKGKEDTREQRPVEVSMFGPTVPIETASESIVKMMSNLTSDQIFELLQQTKTCIQSNPEESREMLIQNPQLAFALVHALIIMKIIDPKMAHDMLIKQPKQMLDYQSRPIQQQYPSKYPISQGEQGQTYINQSSDISSYLPPSSHVSRESNYVPQRIPRVPADNQPTRQSISPEFQRNQPSNEHDRYYDDRYHDTSPHGTPQQYSNEYSKYDRGYRHSQYDSYHRDTPAYSSTHNDPRINQRRERVDFSLIQDSPPRENRSSFDPRNSSKTNSSLTSDPRIHHSKLLPHDDHNFDRRDREYTAQQPPMQYHNDPQRFHSSRYK